jgi:two-component system, sensor histidine kinase RegB
LQLTGNAPAPQVITDTTLEQGLLNLFNNAADAGPVVEVEADWDNEWLTIEVRDKGPGFAHEVLEKAGRMPFPGHAGGSGIGLFLAQAAISRLGGQLTLFNDGGGVARIELPVRTNP